MKSRLVFVISASILTCNAANHYWNTGEESYADASRWDGDGTIPGTGDHAFVNNAGNVLIKSSDPLWTLNDLRAGETANSSGSFTLDGGEIHANGWIRLGFGANATGTLIVSDGLLLIPNKIYIGGKDQSQASGGAGVLEIRGGTLRSNDSSKVITIGPRDTSDYGYSNTSGKLIQTGGSIETTAQVFVGNGAAGSGTLAATYQMDGGNLSITNNWFVIGRQGAYGELLMSGGSISKTGVDTNLNLGVGATGKGIIQQSGGTITNTEGSTWFGKDGAFGSWTISGSAEAYLGRVFLTQVDIATGELHLDGGKFHALRIDPAISDPNGTSYSAIHFNGGLLLPTADDPNFISAALTHGIVETGGARIDTLDHAIVFDADLTGSTGDGGFIKTGTGSLVLTGQYNYTGTTEVSSGQLVLDGNIQSNAEPDYTNSTIGTFTCGALDMESTATFTVEIDSDHLACDLVKVGGDVNLNSCTLVISDLGSSKLTTGSSFQLITSEGEIHGQFSDLAEGASIAVGENTFSIHYGNLNTVTLTVEGDQGTSTIDEWLEEKIPDENSRGLDADPDHDGLNNLMEFALGCNPTEADSPHQARQLIKADTGSENSRFQATFPVRQGATFSSDQESVTAVIDGIRYTVEASRDLTDYHSLNVVEIPNVATDELPDLPDGWEYHTFQLETDSIPSDKGFIRLHIQESN
ncbi:autotransporter-associated beta strand repeat-containing protein [Luteolibacter pohnpeiensis]|uniref:Autotransporter-associated beta strand repeat-containing protein n=1 Tax=Luteolibacter pohnpeiensis TaxID=454153 RepID=A0A934VVG2_9BACT|nr:autotransporter-associated beta strand repeat-containing protein [Luteolibacter pohnpeiensis]MBK1881494.1 autotransporter-associated beta strand repeat-containing protein [Luteolibacter pohnpeiensis]